MNLGSNRGNKTQALELLRRVQQRLDEAGVPDARRHAEWMMEEALSVDRASLYAYPEREIPSDTARRIERWVERRCAGEPIQYILGRTFFRGLRLHVSPAVLIPRPETEEVVEEALSRIREVVRPRVLDVGTGSGCIALAIKHERPDASVYAVDNSESALELARANADELSMDVHFIEADMLSDQFLQDVPSDLDLVVSNPPYVQTRDRASLPKDVLEHEPHEALFSGEDPVRYYRVLVPHARRLLRDGGWLVMEIHEEIGGRIADLLKEGDYSNVNILPDLAGKDRIAVACRSGNSA